MMKTMKKIGAILLAAAMIFALSAIAFAAVPASDPDGLDAISFTVTLTNDDGFVPGTTFTYTIEAGAGVDGTPIQDGVDDAVQPTASAEFTANDSDTVDVELTLDPSVFSQPGVYRYVITQEDLTDEQVAIGITADEENPKYLDLYVAWADPDDHSEGLIITNVVLSEDGTITVTADGYEYEDEDKVAGFENSYGTEPNPEEFADFTLEKVVDGAAASTTQAFDFAITLTYEDDDTDDATDLTGLEVEVGGVTLVVNDPDSVAEITLAHGESITFTVPKGVIVNVDETYANPEGYTVSAAEDGNLTGFSFSGTASFGTMGDDDATITYTNTLDEISPTGVAMRIAPFMAIGGAGIIFLALSKKSKKEEE